LGLGNLRFADCRTKPEVLYSITGGCSLGLVAFSYTLELSSSKGYHELRQQVVAKSYRWLRARLSKPFSSKLCASYKVLGCPARLRKLSPYLALAIGRIVNRPFGPGPKRGRDATAMRPIPIAPALRHLRVIGGSAITKPQPRSVTTNSRFATNKVIASKVSK
jgi:hypothetical protein